MEINTNDLISHKPGTNQNGQPEQIEAQVENQILDLQNQSPEIDKRIIPKDCTESNVQLTVSNGLNHQLQELTKTGEADATCDVLFQETQEKIIGSEANSKKSQEDVDQDSSNLLSQCILCNGSAEKLDMEMVYVKPHDLVLRNGEERSSLTSEQSNQLHQQDNQSIYYAHRQCIDVEKPALIWYEDIKLSYFVNSLVLATLLSEKKDQSCIICKQSRGKLTKCDSCPSLIGHLRCIKETQGSSTLCQACQKLKNEQQTPDRLSSSQRNIDAVNNMLATQLMAQDFSRAINSNIQKTELSQGKSSQHATPRKGKFKSSINCQNIPERENNASSVSKTPNRDQYEQEFSKPGFIDALIPELPNELHDQDSPQKTDMSQKDSSPDQNGFYSVLGKRNRRPPVRNEDIQFENSIAEQENKQKQAKLAVNGKLESPAFQQKMGTINLNISFFDQKHVIEMFGPLFHLDKLQILRKENLPYDVLLCANKDLKTLTKERRVELQALITDLDIEMEESTLAQNTQPIDNILLPLTNGHKRRKRGNYLSNSSGGKKPGSAETLWIENIQQNQILREKRRVDAAYEKKIRTQAKKAQEALQDQSMNSDNEEEKVDDDRDEKELEMCSVEERESSPYLKNQQIQTNWQLYHESSKITCLEDIHERFTQGYYHSLDTLLQDVNYLVSQTQENRCKNPLANKYLDNYISLVSIHVNKKRQDFNDKWRDYFKQKFYENSMRFVRMQDPNWRNDKPPTTVAKRQYNNIEDYKKAFSEQRLAPNSGQEKLDLALKQTEAQKDQIHQKMRTSKLTKCQGTCCLNDGAPRIEGSLPSCECAQKKSECSNSCGCDPDICNNRQMSRKQSLVLGNDIVERISWGIDICTAVNLITVLPIEMNNQAKSDFIEDKVIFAVQQQDMLGYDIRLALNYIIEAETRVEDPVIRARFSQADKELARIILDAVSQQTLSGHENESKNDVNFRVHSKGLGIFCRRKEGIRQDSLVVEYFGEIYNQWYWYEKQDVLKQGQNKGQLSKELPEFYNIIYERHFDDPEGYDILTVDPVLYGNYASRLSHSCNPNCQTVIKVKHPADQERLYSIGMFASKEIKYGEELCFNYCSFTESEKEFEAAACLCGTVNCNGRFLQLASDKKFMAVMKKYHTFVDRNYILFRACMETEDRSGGNGIDEKDLVLLDQCGLRSSVLTGLPKWLIKWAALICEYIEFEKEKYPVICREEEIQARQNAADGSEGKECQPNKALAELIEADLKIDAKNIRESKIQNVAITLNKVHHVLKQMGTLDPPIRRLTPREVFEKLWATGAGYNGESLRAQIEQIFKIIERPCPEVEVALECIDLVDQEESWSFSHDYFGGNLKVEDQYFEEKLSKARQALFFISQHLRAVKSREVAIPSLCDNLFFYSHTETYFTPTEYSKAKGYELNIRKCDIYSPSQPVPIAGIMDNNEEILDSVQDKTVKSAADLGKSVYKGFKEYDPSYIWGQLVGWYKQTVDKPNASLSADRRGTLSMPDIESFRITQKNQENMQPGIKRKKKAGGKQDESDEEVIVKASGSRSRPRATAQPIEAPEKPNKGGKGQNNIVQESNDIKVLYPNKKNPTRQGFLEGWNESFSKQWDCCCHWNFKNKQRMYGSVQFESVVKANSNREKRLDYFKEILEHLESW